MPAGSGPSTCPTVVDPVGFLWCGWWKRTGPVVGVVRGALLGPETTGPVPFGGGGGVVSGFPASCRWSGPFRGPLTTSVGGVGVVV